jgi:hypothetical protein
VNAIFGLLTKRVTYMRKFGADGIPYDVLDFGLYTPTVLQSNRYAW